jgi:hypothetical protein
VASTQSKQDSSLTAEQASGLRVLNGQLTQLLGQLDAQGVADSAKQGMMSAGQQAKPHTVPQHVQRSTMAPWVVLLAALERQMGRGSAPSVATAGTSTAMQAGSSYSKPWPADFELSMANATLHNVPVSQLNNEGTTMFAQSCRSTAQRGGLILGAPKASDRHDVWKAWVQSRAGPATTGDTHVPFAMLSTSAQQRMLKESWEVKQREASQGQTAAAGTSTATKAGPLSSEPWPADLALSMANEKIRNVPVCQLNSEGITMLAELYRSSAAPGVLGCPAGRRPRLAQWKTWVQSRAAPATTGDTYVTFAMLATSAQQHMLKSFWERKQRDASQGQLPRAE